MPKARPSYILCTRNFSKGAIQRIRDATPPEWSIQESDEPVRATEVGGNILFLLSGSDHSMAIRYAGGSCVGRVSITMRDLETLFETIL